MSSFTVHLAAINYDNKFSSWITLESEAFTVHGNGLRTFEVRMRDLNTVRNRVYARSLPSDVIDSERRGVALK